MNRKQILIIDDALTVRLYHRSILERGGYKVDEAINGIEALEKIYSSGTYDLYLVDINMAKMDGYSFLKELRKQKIFQSPAIMISTEEGDWDKEKAYQAGANYYLKKPVKPETLLLYVKILLGQGESYE